MVVETKEKAYTLGFAWADGHLSKRWDFRISIKANDAKVLAPIFLQFENFHIYKAQYDRWSPQWIFSKTNKSKYLILKELDAEARFDIIGVRVKEGKVDVIESVETTHYSIVDKWGNAVAITTTLNGNYGSKVFINELGFFLNNEMDDFSAKPGTPNLFGLIGGDANSIAPQKRMLSLSLLLFR